MTHQPDRHFFLESIPTLFLKVYRLAYSLLADPPLPILQLPGRL